MNGEQHFRKAQFKCPDKNYCLKVLLAGFEVQLTTCKFFDQP